MDMAKNLHIKSFCQPNAILTFSEYLEDYASERTKKAGYDMVKRLLNEIHSDELRKTVADEVNQIKKGKRDIFH